MRAALVRTVALDDRRARWRRRRLSVCARACRAAAPEAELTVVVNTGRRRDAARVARLAGRRHRAVCALGRGRREAWLGTARRHVPVHGRARAAGRRDVVPARRHRPGDASATDRAAAGRLAAEPRHGRAGRAAGHPGRQRPADDRPGGRDVGPAARRRELGALPGVLRASAHRRRHPRRAGARNRTRLASAWRRGSNRGSRSDRVLPEQSLRQRRTDPAGAGHSRSDPVRPRPRHARGRASAR